MASGTKIVRCSWPRLDGNPVYEKYHDEFWGVPERENQKLWRTVPRSWWWWWCRKWWDRSGSSEV